MCGIAGILSSEGAAPPERSTLAAMIRSLHHRGPDGQGFYGDTRCGLAHARLSIIDLSQGGQPIANEDRTVWTVFNGEIFNYIELRATLEAAGHTFRTHSDTEVIVHLYEEYGARFVDHLNGQFAIAVWDTKLERLVLARDRTGIRPLFYTHVGDRLLFASEVKALFTVPEVPRRLNLSAVGDVMTYWSALSPDTVFEGIQSLPPGHTLTVEKRSEQLACYWDWVFPSQAPRASRSEADYAEELRELLVDAVRLQLRADVPVGAYLSGGLDSSAIAALVKAYHQKSLLTFSIAFEDPEFDESAFQSQMAAHLDTQHTQILCRKADIAAIFPDVIWHTETPILRTAPAPLMMLSKAVRESGLKVVLTGEGADEVFGGYDLYKEALIRRFWARNPASRWRPALLDRLYPYLRHSPQATKMLTRRFYGQGLGDSHLPTFAHGPRWATTRRSWQFFSAEARATLGERDPAAHVMERLPPAVANYLPMGRDQYLEAHTLMSGYLLASQGDRVAMANSIEGRFPFLDHRVIEFANGLPPTLKLRGLTEKYLLRRSVRDLLPAEVHTRTKQPYRAPDSQSFFTDGKAVDYVDDLLSPARLRRSGYFDAKAVGKLVEKCRTGRAIGFSDNMAFVGVLSTMLVDEMFLGPAQASPHATPAAASADLLEPTA